MVDGNNVIGAIADGWGVTAPPPCGDCSVVCSVSAGWPVLVPGGDEPTV